MQTVFVSLLHQVPDMFVINSVVHLLTFTIGGHKPQVAQNTQLVRGGAWAKPTLRCQLTNIGFSVKQDSE